MTNAELASALNDEFKLEGHARLSANVIRQWVDWGLLPKAQVGGRIQGGGPIWGRQNSAIMRARRFAEMRIYGLRSERALVAEAYIEWDAVSFDRAKHAILGEFCSVKSKLRRNLTADIPAGPVSEFSSTKRRALRNQGGPLDPIFRSTQFELSTDTILAAMQSTFAGISNEGDQFALIANALAQMAPSLAPYLPSHLLEMASTNALFAPSDEVEFSGEAVLALSTQAQFASARKTTMKFVRRMHKVTDGRYAHIFPDDSLAMLSMMKTLLPQISTGPWLVTRFTHILMMQDSKNIAH
ncbi:hypothetical protein [Sphingomonas sp.]|uniref:hypothetical protein n=1 Tax=Sphingomonas sp. TaxID=28214 RepID=UPI0025ED2848|nr:hypothetical protein [Sphingomonas sp.]